MTNISCCDGSKLTCNVRVYDSFSTYADEGRTAADLSHAFRRGGSILSLVILATKMTRNP